MSYDLFFAARSGKGIDRKAFRAFFKGRKHYEVGEGQAVYQNEDTGVYFIFDEPEKGVASFNLNYFRPHTFGVEAAIELEAFAKGLDVVAADSEGEAWAFTRERFLKEWNEGNRFGYKAMVAEMKKGGAAVHAWPTKKVRAVWEWNYARPGEEEMEKLGVFVPTIFAAEVKGEAWSMAIWPPECPILLPEVDGVLVPLAQKGKGTEELALVPWAEMEGVVRSLRVENDKRGGLARYRVGFDGERWPGEVGAFLGRQRKAMGEMKGVGMDEVLDAEMITG